jgi:ribosomal-protein-alanine N-acetyltransferase
MIAFNFSPFPVLITPRLFLRRLTTDDADNMFIMRSNKSTMRYVPRPLAKEKKDVLEIIERINTNIDNHQGINWVLELKESKQFVGLIGYHRIEPENHRAEVGYMIQKQHEGNGYSTEALKEVVKYGFNEMKLHSIEAVIDPENSASEKILKKCGFVKEAHFRENEFWEGKYIDSAVYSLLNK